MELQERKKRKIFMLCPAAHIVALMSAAVILLHVLLRDNHALMAALSQGLVRPVHRALSRFWSFTNASAAEWIIAVFAVVVLSYIVYKLLRIVRGEGLRGLYALLITLAAAGLFIYALYSTLWGVYYYGDDFETQSGLAAEEISTEQLELVTRYFAARLNEYGALVARDERGFCASDRDEILAKSPEVFLRVQEQFPCLEGPPVHAKGVYFSRVLSYLDFTGFFFPFTAEANVNTDFPVSGFAATVAHELSHQRGVAKEQEANFVAVMASLEYGDVDYCYSACELAYTHLGNALYKADYEAWLPVYESLSEAVRLDMALSAAYWKQFETPVQTVSNTVYEGFLQSYDQTLGLKSYGACVDLLVNYYEKEAAAFFAETTEKSA